MNRKYGGMGIAVGLCIGVALGAAMHNVGSRVQELGIPFVFTNQHAYPAAAEFFSDLADLERVDWPLLQSRNFKHDPDDPGKKERYQAEALIWKHLPINALLGVCCYNQAANSWIQSETARRKLEIQINTQPGWYF
jgi:hypothetical protein